MNKILQDIQTGALPAREIPGFVIFMLGRAFWPLMAIILGVALAWLCLR